MIWRCLKLLGQRSRLAMPGDRFGSWAVCSGSDAPIESRPFLGMYAAVTRRSEVTERRARGLVS